MKQRHPLVESLLAARGNPRACMYTEPLWGIPFNLFSPFASVYMLTLGMTDRSLGLLASVGLGLQIVTSLLGGPITDKFGRKRATLIFDILSWSVPTAIWALAQNPAWFYAAALFNSLLRITMTSWTCLFIEDAPRAKVVHFWTWVHIAGIVAGVFTPVAGLLIERFTLVPTMRAIYAFAFLSMTAKFIVLNVYADETRQGKLRMEETDATPIHRLAGESLRYLPKIFASRGTVIAIAMLAIHAIYVTVRGTFFAVLLTEGLAFPVGAVGLFPALRSLIILLVFFVVIPRLHQDRYVRYLLIGFVTTIVSLILLVIAPVRGYALATIATVVEALGAALLAPYLEGLITNAVDPHHRARILAVANTFVLLVASPSGWIAGVLSEKNKAYPFLFASAMLVVAVIVLLLFDPERSRALRRRAHG